MSNSVKFSIDGDTNAEQVAGRAKAAVGGLDKQIEGIGKKFGSGFKDIFLSFLGPMALLGTAIAFIGKIIADNQKKLEDANQAAIDGTNDLMSAEDSYYARKRQNEIKSKDDVEKAKVQRETTTREFLQNDPRASEIFKDVKETQRTRSSIGMAVLASLADKPHIQDKVFKIIAEDMKNNPAATVLKDSTFQGPAGFSNVIGVGANPVLENMTRQTDIQQQILEYIKAQVPNVGRLDVPDFTKRVPLTLQKSGLT